MPDWSESCTSRSKNIFHGCQPLSVYEVAHLPNRRWLRYGETQSTSDDGIPCLSFARYKLLLDAQVRRRSGTRRIEVKRKGITPQEIFRRSNMSTLAQTGYVCAA